jgi:predicted metal-dependent HD superfamily phosphohydrolase
MKIEKNSLYGTFKDSFEYSKPDYISEAVSLINSYGVNIDEIEVRERYSEPHRHFHTIEHLNDVLGQVFELYKNSVDLPEMVMSAVFHDIIYDPQRKDNEEKSAELFEKCIDSKKLPLKMYLLSKKIILEYDY